jgi:hypothetical protein
VACVPLPAPGAPSNMSLMVFFQKWPRGGSVDTAAGGSASSIARNAFE